MGRERGEGGGDRKGGEEEGEEEDQQQTTMDQQQERDRHNCLGWMVRNQMTVNTNAKSFSSYFAFVFSVNENYL